MTRGAIRQNGSTLILRLAVVVLALLAAAICVALLPVGIMTDETGLYRWILLGLYLPAIPFFYAVYQTMKLLRFIDNETAFSEESAAALGAIKKCGVLIATFFALGMPYLFYVADSDDAPGVVALGLVIIGASIVVAVFAAVLQKLLTSAMTIKAENELTV